MNGFETSWAWVKKHATLVGGLFVGAMAFLLGVSTKKRPVLIQGQDPVKKQVEKETDAAVAKAEVVAQEQKAAALEVHQHEVSAAVEAVQHKTQELESHPTEINAYLTEVGDDVRKGNP